MRFCRITLYSTILLLGLLSSSNLYPQDFSSYNDGPYVFDNGDSIEVARIVKGELIRTKYHSLRDSSKMIEIQDSFQMPIGDLRASRIVPDDQMEFDNVPLFAAMSDIHGQYDLMIKILNANGIIDEGGKWSFGNGHLVIDGDILDRGDKCVEILWFLIKLERQALKAGGMVHVLIGNHEMMVLKSDLRYINKKYRYTSAKFKLLYSDIMGPDSYLGAWIRSKPIYMSINDNAFVHGGIHKDFFNLGVDINDLNALFRNYVIDEDLSVINADETLSWLYYENGPLWTRDYASYDDFTIKTAKQVLKKLGKKRIIVGHTSLPEIRSIFDNKVIFIDSSIKLGVSGEILIYDKNRFYRCNEKGNRVRLESIY